MDFPFVVFNFNNGDKPVDIKGDIDSIAKAVSYFGGVKGLDLLVTTPLDTPVFDTFGAFLNRVYDSAFDRMAYNSLSQKYCLIAGKAVRDISGALYSEE